MLWMRWLITNIQPRRSKNGSPVQGELRLGKLLRALAGFRQAGGLQQFRNGAAKRVAPAVLLANSLEDVVSSERAHPVS